ncbi:serine/threonine-protein kinase BLUS1 [Rutidosis leptorrhynchoides]|uniref:serine/threonine-protein kinase BLUS1 n=1 Tax=Rutidosis leptorrhynchoides TaxID=125765 RepID=UPI003A9A46BA
MEASKKKFPLNANDYKLYEEVGEGVSASVYRALCVPLNEIVAIKVLDLEKCNNDMDGIRREVQTMSLINHPNLLPAYCSFATGHNLWVVMPYMAGGSCLHIMKSSYPDGFEEPVIATLLREVLKALVYLHAHGHIHRDVKAGNILANFNGSIKLADFGVSACLFDAGDRQRSRNTFVGTPCWMAPEVMQQLHGYDFKADIWSFGITALELAHGHAPFSKYPPMKVLLMTLQNAPPGLDYERDKKFSKSFKDMVATCLVKDPKKRPSAEKLIKHPFFKHAKTADYLERTILYGLSPLGDRFRILKAKEADLLLQNKELYVEEQMSQQVYIRGISAWNFNLEDLKNQAMLINDYDEVSNVEDPIIAKQQNGVYNNHSDAKSDEICNLEDSFAALPIQPQPLQALDQITVLWGCFDISEEDVATISQTERDETPLNLNPEDKDSVPVLGPTSSVSAASFIPSLQTIFQHNMAQREEILRLIKFVDQTSSSSSANPMDHVELGNNGFTQIPPSPREIELHSQVIQLQQSVGSLVEQLQRQKMRNAQLEKQLIDLVKENGIKG